LMEFRFFCKHLVLANGANDLHNELKVKGETSRFILRSIRDLEEKIKEDLTRLQKDPLLIVGSGLSAADAILLAQKYHIRIVHVIRRNVSDPELIFNKLPKKIYPEYQRVYEQMVHNKYTYFNNSNAKGSNENNTDDTTINTAAATTLAPQINRLKALSSNDINILVNDSLHNNSIGEQNQSIEKPNYILYDEHQVKYFTSKRTCVLVHQSNHQQKVSKSLRALMRIDSFICINSIISIISVN
jgi:thioredoxin reductase